jgi:glycosyltransferase involved in cell wall biosynthesis
MSISLSYVLTTYNKLEYIKVTLPVLISACQPDEEIIVIDGGSNDGSAAFLHDLYQQGKIHQFISERDKGESHGTNKAFLMAKGEVIKIITDDDAYSFSAIQRCKQFMLDNPDVDVLGCDGYSYMISNENPEFTLNPFIDNYKRWQKEHVSFFFCGLSLMLRKSSLPILGLFNTSVRMIDVEYTMRITASKCKLAWFTGVCFVNIANENSNSIKWWKLSMIEREKMDFMYLDRLPFMRFMKKDRIKNIFRPVKRILFGKIRNHNRMDFPSAFANARKKIESDFTSDYFLK